MKIIDYIKKNGIEKTVSDFCLETNDTEDLIQLNYHMIDSPVGIEEVNECRGLILNKKDYSVVAYPFYRFYNEHEGCAEKIEKGQLQEKMDGSIIILYYYNGWQVATRGRINADGTVGNDDITFRELFLNTVNFAFDDIPINVNLMFELVGPKNRIITYYPQSDVYLIGGRNIETGNELSNIELDGLACKLNIKRPKVYDYNDKNDITRILEEINPIDEGFVLVDYSSRVNGNFRRIKIKNPRYLAIKNLINAGGEMTDSRIFTIIKNGDKDEVLSYFPEFKDIFENMENKIDRFCDIVENRYNSVVGLKENRKEFALAIKDLPYKGFLFAKVDGKIKDIREGLFNMIPNKACDLIEKGS